MWNLSDLPHFLGRNFVRLLCWLDDFSCSEPCAYVGDLYLGVLSYLAVFDKDYESLNSGNSVTFSARLCDLYVVFLSCFNWFWTKAAATEAVASAKTSFAV